MTHIDVRSAPFSPGCEGRSIGIFQIQVRRAQLVDTDVRDAVGKIVCRGDAQCGRALSYVWASDPAAIFDRLRNDNLGTLYAAAYLHRLSTYHPPGTDWRT